MNLFCFTLEGSTESMYEPANNQKHKEVLPKYHFSPVLLRRNADWGGSDPSITSNQPQGKIKLKRDSKRSCVPTSVLDKETLEKDIHHTCWISCGDKKDLLHQTKVQKEEMGEATCNSRRPTAEGRVRNRTRADLPAQGSETTADTSESMKTTGRLRKLQNLVQAKSGTGKGKSTSKSNADADVSNNNPVLTCMGRRRRAERRLSKTASLPQQLMQQQVRDPHKEPEEDGTWNPRVGNYLWSPLDYPQVHSSFYQNCQEPRHDLCGLCQTTEWDRFETLIQELDRKQSNLFPPQMIHSITDLHLYQNTLTRFERFEALRQHTPSKKPQDNGSCLQTREQIGEPTESRPQRMETESLLQSDGMHIEASPEETLGSNRDVQTGEAEKREADHGRPITKACSRSSNSLESVYSLNSGQSSSSGVTSGSNCSSNRNSLKLEDELLCTRQFCGRARVHTEFVPSPYDTESLKLQVGDVIDIITKSPMGTWTGMLNGKVGNFKFIYVDVLRTETSGAHLETHLHRVRHKSTVQEVLKRLSLEEYSTCLQLGGYQTVDDLMRLRENHLMELNVTDPEHRQRLLAAVNSLQQLRSDCQLENEADREAGSSTENRDSGCPMPSDSPDNITEEAHLHFLSEHPLPADATAS